MQLRIAFFLLLAFSLIAEAKAAAGDTISEEAERWVETTLGSLSLKEKAAQMVMIRVFGRYYHPSSADYRRLVEEVHDLKVGGVIAFASELESLPRLLNRLQREAEVPLLVSADMERGIAFRIPWGTVPVPYAMAVGATRSEELARFTGEVTAREGRALGIHWALAPVADVNVNPANPVIHVRSYGEDPDLVSRLATAFIEGARSGGLMTTVKHFPGHGDTTVDSHHSLPVISADRARLEAVELPPFRRAIEAGADSVMAGHLAVPALDPTSTPATLSPVLIEDLLRRQMGFSGLIVTDAMEMKGVAGVWTGAAAVRAVAAGSDAVLLPPDPRVAIQSLVRAVEEGELSEARLDDSVRRLLVAKARLGLHRERLVDPEGVLEHVADPDDVERARALARASITVVKNEGGVLPLRAEEPLRVLHLTLVSHPADVLVGGLPEKGFAARQIDAEHVTLGPEIAAATATEILERAAGFTHIVVSAVVRASGLQPTQHRLLEELLQAGPPVIVVALGTPYLLVELPEIPVYVCAYGAVVSSSEAALEALFGEFSPRGKLPVSLPELYPYGHGLEIPEHAMSLKEASPREAGLRPEGLREVDRILDDFLARKAFPGGVVAVGYRGRLSYLRPFGRLSFAEDAPATTRDTLYDIASLTKVVATTTMAMMLVDEGRLDLDAQVEDFLPRFTGPGKEAVSVRHLLTHASGVDWWAPLYKDLRGPKAFLRHIEAMDLVYEPGSRSKYSDLGLILLGEILERVSGRSLEAFTRERIFAPLGMQDTLFRPGPELRPRIAPTEHDAWRGRLVHGEVHDENAFALGGVAPHAGLFSTAPDLARFAQMILYGGVFEHRRIVSRSMLARFTKRAGVPDSTRALGWDTPSAEGSSAGSLFSPSSFGHTGFTGTSIWVDPERQLFVILLTNRVHPTRENTLIRQIRPALADAVVRALEAPPPPLVEVGLEHLESGGAAPLGGKRLGLVVHAASRTADGRHAVDVLRALGSADPERPFEVVRLFSPEHGLRGRAAAGQPVESGRDPVSGLDVVSLYGERKKPTTEDLAGLDALVFDLQGAGVRFYTYVSTLIYCLEAAAVAGIELIVLDRPNPLGGERIEGPMSAPREVVPESFVNVAPGPLVHGLTLGEMARFVNARRDEPVRLTVIPMRGWKREMTWADTGRRWVAPSPNLRSAEAALVYPGTALLEATNVSEGRGTAAPFLRIGAPWIGQEDLESALSGLRLPGLAFEPIRFTPRGSTAAPHPKFADQACRGLRIRTMDRGAVEPYRSGVRLLVALARQEGFLWRRDGEALTWLLGTPRVLEGIRRDLSADEILAADHADHEAWRRARQRSLLYQ